MTCPTCDHTMHRINSSSSMEGVWWCPRCGTSKRKGFATLVERPRVLDYLCELYERAENCGADWVVRHINDIVKHLIEKDCTRVHDAGAKGGPNYCLQCGVEILYDQAYCEGCQDLLLGEKFDEEVSTSDYSS
jgi:hypothetical protein